MATQLSLPTEKVTWTIQNFVKLHNEKKLIINTEYQRSEVWKRNKKRLLMDSILKDYDIGSIVLRQQKEGKWEILDGQQRLKAIFDFTDNEFSLSKETTKFEGKYWKELGPDVQWGQFMNRQVYCTKIYSVDDETTSEIFLRVQEGMPLNSAEKLNAMRGKLRNEIYEISQHPFFIQTRIKEYRFAYRYLCAQIAMQEMDKGVTDHQFKQAKLRNLKKMYKDYRDNLPPNVLANMLKTFIFLQKTLGTSAQTISKKSDFLAIYLLASYLLQRFAIKGKELKLRGFIVRFLREVETAKYEGIGDYYSYWVARSSSPDSKGQIEKRFEIILKKFLEYEPTIQPKDPQRGFDWGQKLTIYVRAYKKARQQSKEEAECKICGKPTPLAEGEPDHIKPHNLGGFTTVENGQWTCVSCNRIKSDKDSVIILPPPLNNNSEKSL